MYRCEHTILFDEYKCRFDFFFNSETVLSHVESYNKNNLVATKRSPLRQIARNLWTSVA